MDIKDTSSAKNEQKSDKDLVLYKSLEASLFSSSRKLYFVYAKAEKLASAVFLVTELVPESNPLKQNLRHSSLSALSLILDFVLALRSRMGVDERRQDALAIVQEISSLCRIALTNPGASRMNFTLLEKEYENLLRNLLLVTGGEASEEILSPELLSVRMEPIPGTSSSSHSNFYISSTGVRNPQSPSRSEAPVIRGRLHTNPEQVSYKTPKSVLEKHPSEFPEKGHSEKKNREVTILKIVGEKGPLGIKEIAHGIPGCSEKTIQRLLADLVSRGTLKREGERRWSQYSLAKTA